MSSVPNRSAIWPSGRRGPERGAIQGRRFFFSWSSASAACFLKSGSSDFSTTAVKASLALSILPVFKELGQPLEELDDWNCCGATAYFSVDDVMATAVSGRNLALAEKQGKDIIAPCAGCYLTLRKSNAFLQSRNDQALKVLDSLKKAVDAELRT